MIRIVLRAIECFVGAVFFGLAPVAIGFILGWIMKGEKENGKKKDDN